MHTVSEENYIKAIYHIQKDQELVATNDIASRMNTKASSVTDMLKKLADKQLVTYIPYKGAQLTKKGVQCANEIIRKHRLWEVFLVDKLNFTWDEVHEVAEQLEHIQSRKLTNELDKFLNYPKHDPHGDAIPDQYGNYEKTSKIPLSQLNKGDRGLLTGLIDTSKEFLNYLDKKKMNLGTAIQVVDFEDFDGSYTIKTDSETHQISQQIASQIYIKLDS